MYVYTSNTGMQQRQSEKCYTLGIYNYINIYMYMYMYI